MIVLIMHIALSLPYWYIEQLKLDPLTKLSKSPNTQIFNVQFQSNIHMV